MFGVMRRRNFHETIDTTLRKMDPTWIQVCIRARDLARAIATEFLGQFMLNGKDKQQIEEVVERFMKEGELLSHGRIIRSNKAKEYGLNIDVIPRSSDLDEALWELHTRCENYVQSRKLAKYLICRSGGINVNVSA